MAISWKIHVIERSFKYDTSVLYLRLGATCSVETNLIRYGDDRLRVERNVVTDLLMSGEIPDLLDGR